jgi:cytochrome P450
MSHDHEETWDPLDASVLDDQRRAYDRMREQCPVAHSKLMSWSLFRHDDIVAVLDDPATFINMSRFPAIPNGLNPPVHGPYNAALAAFFTPEHMAQLEPHLRGIATRQLELLGKAGAVEFIDAFTVPYIFGAACALLGWPEQEREPLVRWADGNARVAFSGDAATGKELADLFAAQVLRNLDAHRDSHATAPASPDATDRLLLTEVNGKRLRDDEIVTILRNWVAGHGTAADALGIVVMHVARNIDVQNQLRRSPALIPAAIEEILRSDGPLVANRRTTTREVDIQGHVIPKDANLSLMWIAANRDPRAFAKPDAIDLARNNSASLVWGRGIHLCLGAPLARLEMRVALEELLARTMRIEAADSPPARKVYPGNGLATLHLRLA